MLFVVPPFWDFGGQNIKIWKHQNMKTSKCQDSKMSKHQNVKTSTYQTIKTSKHQNMHTRYILPGMMIDGNLAVTTWYIPGIRQYGWDHYCVCDTNGISSPNPNLTPSQSDPVSHWTASCLVRHCLCTSIVVPWHRITGELYYTLPVMTTV